MKALLFLMLVGCASAPKPIIITVAPPADNQPAIKLPNQEFYDEHPKPLSPPGNVNGWIAMLIP